MSEPKEKITDQAVVEKAKQIAKRLVNEFKKHVQCESVGGVNFDNMITASRAKECAIIACNLKIEGLYPWHWNYILYNEVIKQIANL